MRHKVSFLWICALIWLVPGCGGDKPGSGTGAPAGGAIPPSQAAPGATVFIISPINGTTVSSPVEIKFGISGMDIAPAGKMRDNSGHHHLIVDADTPDPSKPILSDENHLHFGKGQTETSVELAPGPHTLQLVLGDGLHVPHKPPVMSDIVSITVE